MRLTGPERMELIYKARTAAIEFLARSEKLCDTFEEAGQVYYPSGPDNAAMIRASLDLSMLLAKVRMSGKYGAK